MTIIKTLQFLSRRIWEKEERSRQEKRRIKEKGSRLKDKGKTRHKKF